MTEQEKTHWLTQYLANCLGEELPTQVGDFLFNPEALPEDTMLAKPLEAVAQGRLVHTFTLSQVLDVVAHVDVLTKESFAVACTNHPVLGPWFLWSVDRGTIAL